MNINFIFLIVAYTCIVVIGVCGVFLVTGMTGIFSLGQGAFMAMGAYTSAILAKNFNLPFFFCLLAAIIIGILGGLLIALPTLKLRKDYMSLVTFGFAATITAILNGLVDITGGGMGLSGIPKYTSFTSLVLSAIIIIILVHNFKYSRFGRECFALRTDELAARSMGINTTRTKIIVFLFSAVITSYAGALYAHYLRFIDPSMFDWNKAAEWIILVFVGGPSSLTGAVVSTLLLTFLPEFLRFANEWRIVIYSLIVLGIVNFRPKGLFGEFELFPNKYDLPK